MKVLYIAHYKEGTGWSKAAIDYILALDSAGVDVVCRNIKLTKTEPTIPRKILELESKSLSGIDYCIQHVLPHHLVGSNKFKKNIAYFVAESSIKYSGWYAHLQQMDEIWVPNASLADTLAEDGIKEREKIKLVPHTFEISKYQTMYEKINLGQLNDAFKFYAVLDVNDRKNLPSIIKCFVSEFFPEENVGLVLKLKKFGVNEQQLNSMTHQLISNIKKTLRITTSNREIVIPNNLSDEEICSLHNTCDCFLNPSHGEAWSIPSFEAMCFGKTPICSNEGGPAEFIDSTNINTGTLINGTYGICEHNDVAFADLFTGKESWFIPNEIEIKKAMRFYYENKDKINRSAGLKQGMKFSYDNIGSKIKELLND